MSPRNNFPRFTVKQRRHPNLFQDSLTIYALTSAVISKRNGKNERNHRNQRNQIDVPNDLSRSHFSPHIVPLEIAK